MGKSKDFIARCLKEEKTPAELEAESGIGMGLNPTDFSDPQAMQLMKLRGAAQNIKKMITNGGSNA